VKTAQTGNGRAPVPELPVNALVVFIGGDVAEHASSSAAAPSVLAVIRNGKSSGTRKPGRMVTDTQPDRESWPTLRRLRVLVGLASPIRGARREH